MSNNITSMSTCPSSASLKDDGTGIPRNQHSSSGERTDTAWLSLRHVTLHPPHSSRSGPSGEVALGPYDANQPPLPALPLWQNLTSYDYYGYLFHTLTAENQGMATLLLAILYPTNLNSSEGVHLINKRDLAALSCPQVPPDVPVKGNQNTLKKLNVWFIIFKMLFVYRV